MNKYTCVIKNQSRFDLQILADNKTKYHVVSKIVPTYKNKLMMMDNNGKIIITLSDSDELSTFDGIRKYYYTKEQDNRIAKIISSDNNQVASIEANTLMTEIIKDMNGQEIANCSVIDNGYLINIENSDYFEDYMIIMMLLSMESQINNN